MKQIKELELEKRKEIQDAIMDLNYSQKDAEMIFHQFEDCSFIEITAPEEEESMLEWINVRKLHTGRYIGNSYKSGNIIINIKKGVLDFLVMEVSTIGSVLAISADQPLVGILTIFVAIVSSLKMIKKELEKECVFVLAILWESGYRKGQGIDLEEAYHLINEKQRLLQRNELSQTEWNDIMDDLKELECIKLEDGKIILIEELQIEY